MGALTNGLRTARVRRGVAAAAIVLATGGLVLARAPHASAGGGTTANPPAWVGAGVSGASFTGPGAHGQISLSHTKVLAHGRESVFAEVKLKADATEATAERAPLSLVVVLDTSGSMDGEKISRAKESVLGLMHDMRDDDEIAFVRYSSEAELIQPLARLGDVREGLASRVQRLGAGGGTNIPSGLAMGLRTLDDPQRDGDRAAGRVKRIVLVSDGLDGTRAEAERLALGAAEHGITVSSMGIGLDFDESYMSSLARDGHGNFGFVNDGGGLSAFLHRELDEASTTTVENATVRLTLPAGVRFVRASGADARASGDSVTVKMGSLFAGDERRAVIELSTDLDAGEARQIGASARWHRVGGGDADVKASELSLVATRDASDVRRGEDGAVLASATSVLSSQRELEAAQAYAQGDTRKAHEMIQQNIIALSAAAAAAPAPVAARLAKQSAEYQTHMSTFAAAPSSDEGKRAAKSAAAKESSNLDRAAY
jgi:Ca-activated chloride channel family protein